MNIKTINIPKNIEYLEHVLEIKDLYKGDLPPNAIIDKQLTGTGGTYLALTNKVPYIVAIHLVSTIENKVVKQKEEYGHVLAVHGNVTIEEIQQYIKDGGIKILVTYDSVPKVKEALGEKTKDFRLLVDEFHKLLNYLGTFKPLVCINLLEASKDFKSVSYLTATPTNYNYLPKPMQALDIIEFNWEGKTNADLTHAYVKDGMIEKILAISLDKLDTTNEELYIFYNSRLGMVSYIKKLLKCKPELSLKDINIMFASSKANTKFFKSHLGNTFTYGEAPDGVNNKRINVISSMAFEGQDFYPNSITHAIPVTIIVSDPSVKSLLLDIETDVKQIIGRFRKPKKALKRVKNPIIYLWNTQQSDFNLDEEDFKFKVLKQKQESIEMLDAAKTNEVMRNTIFNALKIESSAHIIINETELMLHPYGFEAKMCQYSAMHCNAAHILNIDENDNVLDNSTTITNLLELNEELSSYTIPQINSGYTIKLGRRPSITKLIKEYELLSEDIIQNSSDTELHEEAFRNLENFLILNPLFNEWISSGITISMMKTNRLNKELITKKAIEIRTVSTNEKSIVSKLDLKIGEIYTSKDLVKKLTHIYKQLAIEEDETVKIKATIIKKWYEIKNTPKKVNGEQFNGYKIIRKL